MADLSVLVGQLMTLASQGNTEAERVALALAYAMRQLAESVFDIANEGDLSHGREEHLQESMRSLDEAFRSASGLMDRPAPPTVEEP